MKKKNEENSPLDSKKEDLYYFGGVTKFSFHDEQKLPGFEIEVFAVADTFDFRTGACPRGPGDSRMCVT